MEFDKKKFQTIIVTYRKKNGAEWEETYSTRILDILKQDPTVFEIRYKDSDKLIYRRDS